MSIIDNLGAKYFTSIVGFCAVSLPFISGTIAKDSHGERSRLYYTFGRMLVKLAEAIGRLVLAGRDLARLAGFTARVTQLQPVFGKLNAGLYERTMVAGSEDLNLKPNGGKIIFYIPQRPYMTLGSLGDQLTYLHTGAEATRRGMADQKLIEHLDTGYILERKGV